MNFDLDGLAPSMMYYLLHDICSQPLILRIIGGGISSCAIQVSIDTAILGRKTFYRQLRQEESYWYQCNRRQV
jgi:hypothetical protein